MQSVVENMIFSLRYFCVLALAFYEIAECRAADEGDVLPSVRDVIANEIAADDGVSVVQHYSRVHRNARNTEFDSAQCGGVFRQLQTTISSPGYPEAYEPNTACEYIFKTPFVCPNEYHIQFLNFSVETSKNCAKDRLQIGKTEILCGNVIGIMKYKANDGILRIKFMTDDKIETKGFRLLVTRLPCSGGEATTVFPVFQSTSDQDSINEDGTVGLHQNPETNYTLPENIIQAPIRSDRKIDKSNQYLPPNNGGYSPTGNGYLPPQYPPSNQNPGGFFPPSGIPNSNGNYPYPPSNVPGQYPPLNPYPSIGNYPQNPFPSYGPPGSFPINYPNNNIPFPQNPNQCIPSHNYPPYPQIPIQPTIPPFTHNVSPKIQTFNNNNNIPERDPQDDREIIEDISNESQAQVFPAGGAVPPCCCRPFNQRRFYLTSPGFPNRNNQNSDCLYHIERNHPGICRLRIEMKFFLLGNHDPRFGCVDSFLEIDGRRICGCNTGLRYVSQWGIGVKTIRFRSAAAFAQGIRGFVLDVIQEECPYRISRDGSNRQNTTNWDRSDIGVHVPAILHSAVEQKNSSSLTTYYFYKKEDDDRNAVAPSLQPASPPVRPAVTEEFDSKVEGPSSRFFFPNLAGSGSRCSFGYGHYLRLAADPLWLLKPVCSRY